MVKSSVLHREQGAIWDVGINIDLLTPKRDMTINKALSGINHTEYCNLHNECLEHNNIAKLSYSQPLNHFGLTDVFPNLLTLQISVVFETT